MYQYFFRIDTLELMVDIDAIKRRFESLLPTVDERMRRVIAAAEVSPSITVISVDTKKKELGGTSKTEGESYGSRETRNRCGYMTSSFPSWDESLRMASTTWARIEAG